MHESHSGAYSGHFAGSKLYNTISRWWWWTGMYVDRCTISYCIRCPDCVTVTGASHQHRPPLRPISIQRPFKKIDVHIMDLSCMECGNKQVIVFQDMFSKWPLVFPIQDQRTEQIARLLCEEVIPYV